MMNENKCAAKHLGISVYEIIKPGNRTIVIFIRPPWKSPIESIYDDKFEAVWFKFIKFPRQILYRP